MKKFIKTTICFIVLITTLLFSVIYVIDISGWSDWAYKRFRSSGEKSLILGTSRAAQGLRPEIINSEMAGLGYHLPIYNFSFTMMSSPYGEIYYNAIKKKLSTESFRNGLFILSIDPWSLGFINHETEDSLREKGDCLEGVDYYMRPNIQYILKYARPLTYDKALILHDDGWLEVTVPMDTVYVLERSRKKEIEYENMFFVKSEYRLLWLCKIIRLLKTKGTVILVRIPAAVFFKDLENKHWPTFDEEMDEFARRENVLYISFENRFGCYQMVDGQHIFKDNAAFFTKELCDSIKKR
jgi:hypothetical protein